MGTIAVLGEWHRIEALALAGAEVRAAETAEQAVTEWIQLPPDVAVLILTRTAAGALADRLRERRDLLITVLP